jgi:hypothetical protein
MVLKQEMQGLRRILHCVQSFFRQLMTSQLMLCCLAGAINESLLLHTTTNILTICGWNVRKSTSKWHIDVSCPPDHPWRNNAINLNNKVETREAPEPLSGA